MNNLLWHFGQKTAWGPQQPGVVDLPASGAHVWFFPHVQKSRYALVVSDAERARAADMLPPGKGQEFLRFRSCLRRVLALSYIKTSAPQKIRIALSQNGKPWLPDAPQLHFNLSHSHGALAIAVSRLAVGVDIEKIRPVSDWHGLAQNFLAPTDAAAIANHAETEQSAVFLRFFTAREAYLKATGTGFLPGRPAAGADSVSAPLPPLPHFVGHVCLRARTYGLA